MLELARPTTCGTRCSAGRIQRAAKPPIQKGHKRVVLHRGFAQVRRFGSALSWRRRVAFQRRGDRPHYCFLQRLRCTVTRTNVVARAAVTSRMHASIRSRLRYPCNPHLPQHMQEYVGLHPELPAAPLKSSKIWVSETEESQLGGDQARGLSGSKCG